MNQWINFEQSIAQRLTREELDREQTRAKNFRPEGAAIIRGVAGSGKSLVLRNRAEKLLEDFDDILVLTYNRYMNGWLKSKLQEKGISKKVDCTTFHKWAWDTFKYDYDWDRKDNTRKNIIKLTKNSNLKYQAILVDEGQDFYDEWFQALLEVLDPNTDSLFIVYDNTQSIYGQPHRRKSTWSWQDLGIDIPGGRSQIFDLNYRNSPEILELAWSFIKPALAAADMRVEKRERDEEGRIKNTPSIGSIIEPKKKLSRSSNLPPLLLEIYYEDMASEIARQVKDALNTHPESSIGILIHPQGKDLKIEISRELNELQIDHHAPNSSGERDLNIVTRPHVVVDSWNALKGIEFDAVIVAGIDRLTENTEDRDRDFQEKAGLYTAMTRARDHLVMLYESKNSIVELVENALTYPSSLDSEE